jgi:hypothetical protein
LEIGKGECLHHYSLKNKKNMKTLFASIALSFSLMACSSLTSNTIIKSNESFVLGNNKHSSFRVKLKNVSKNDLEVYYAPIDGGTHSNQNVKQNKTVSLLVDKNTALIISNKSAETGSVDLYVTGDTGLSMDFKK